ncbi:hypothetical protein G6O69_38685 [Pseudenhygromyxa sp. WMMC2535]|uniref:tetratricopeptide repeat protein n=1 Tax=Pseudenhygromyxa sp. WMMC2535 TaxID=2712867 RepID=UPI001551BFB6|nr:tetratricopeptide repeat protein [Pseudenhygromyxa sp. WMMC2535]NVB43134.1 hypothetical protein [Pseudenhygromyxa sp. WMMC2535]NVB43719.1 hypothetical protein [Pseudenhygromyxa sp. WMMC2535]NVB43788.1 hypothetical protein [Pseudenhygromyxa sp. WMMC2535]
MLARVGRLSLAACVALVLLSPAKAAACLWDQETYAAEAEALPCVVDALVGAYIKHTDAYYEKRIEAADAGLAVAPKWLGGFDMKAVALIHLGRLDEAREVLERRAAIDPDGYATHANLGTLYTFTGEYARALEHIDRALELEPQAHFGRERIHRQLVEFLASLEAGEDVGERDFLGLELSDEQRYEGSVAAYEAAGLDDSVIDALVAMIAVYGAESISHIHYALANALALRGERRLAHSAYERAAELRHPLRAKFSPWREALEQRFISERYGPKPKLREGCYLPLDKYFAALRRRAGKYRKAYARWEEKAVADGLPVWTRAGLDAIYEQRGAIEIEVIGAYPSYHPRCPAPGVIRSAGQEPYEGQEEECMEVEE